MHAPNMYQNDPEHAHWYKRQNLVGGSGIVVHQCEPIQDNMVDRTSSIINNNCH